MLHHALTPALALLLHGAMAQVEYGRALHFSGPEAERRVEGMVAPQDPGDATTVEATLMGTEHWASATMDGNSIVLAPVIGGTPRPGTLLRFVVPTDVHGPLLIEHPGADAAPLVRPDGLAPTVGQLTAGRVAEVLHTPDDRWVLLGAEERGCPPGFVSVNAHLCVETAQTGAITYFTAQDRCEDLGGKLCRWDEWYLACVLVGGQLDGLNAAWEWIDDTSNHTHTADQAGFPGCENQRSFYVPVQTGRSRCCYHPR